MEELKNWATEFQDAPLENCPIRTTMRAIQGKWGLLVVASLMSGPKRTTVLLESIPDISAKVLTDTVKHLETEGILTRTVYPSVPPKVEYALTQKGYALTPLLEAMVQWSTLT